MTPFVQLLAGSQWAKLPPPCQMFHGHYGRFEGQINVRLHRNPILRMALRLAGLPTAQTNAVLILTTEINNGVEIWTRRIGTQTLISKRWIEDTNLLAERLGPATIVSRIEADGTGTRQVAKSWRFLGIPMPRALLPVIHAQDHAEAGNYHFDIKVGLPWFGTTLFGYSGHLKTDR